MTSAAGRRNSAHLTLNRQDDALREFETFKRKYLTVNKHITKLNSTLSVRIEALNAQMSELAVENLQLRAQNISLAGQLSREKDKIRRMLHDAETATSSLATRLGTLREAYGVENGPPPTQQQQPIRSTFARPPGAASPPPRVRVSKEPDFICIAECDESDAASSEHSSQPPNRPSSRRDHAHASVPASAPSLSLPVKSSSNKSKTVRRQSGLVSDLLREDRERDREDRERAARVPSPYEMDIVDATTERRASPEYEQLTSSPPSKKKARRLSGPVPSPARGPSPDNVDDAEVEQDLLGSPPLTESETDEVLVEREREREKERQRIEREREREREAELEAEREREREREREAEAERERKAAKAARAALREERAAREREREKERAAREKERERRLAEKEKARDAKEDVRPDDVILLAPVLKSEVQRVPFEPVNANALSGQQQPVKKKSAPTLVPAVTAVSHAAAVPTQPNPTKPSRIPGLTLVVNNSSGTESGTSSGSNKSEKRSASNGPHHDLPMTVTVKRGSTERLHGVPHPPKEREHSRAPVENEPVQEQVAEEGGRTRRARGSVNYAEPKLNTKMRRPDPAEGGPAWPPARRKKATSTGAVPSSGARMRVGSAEDAPIDHGEADTENDAETLFGTRRHTVAV